MKPLLSVLLLSGVALLTTYLLPAQVLIQSSESKTKDNGPVFNEISYESGKTKDTWLMKQTHDGLKLHKGNWDQIKIVVDKTTTPYSATYHQLRDGKEIELRAACYICHANGPRAIRPDYDSTEVNYSLVDRIKIQSMNLKIKTYGRVVLKKTNLLLDGKARKRPLTYDGPQNWKELKVATCLKCHDNEGVFARGKLKWQQKGTIEHLTKTGAMPPWPHTLSAVEKNELQKFLSDVN